MSEPSNMTRMIELERADAVRKALDEAANAIELMNGAEQYQRAWRKAADFLRSFKPRAMA
jgi:hypothetical protein